MPWALSLERVTLSTVLPTESKTPMTSRTDHSTKTATTAMIARPIASRNDELHHRPRVDPAQHQPGPPGAVRAAGRGAVAGAERARCRSRAPSWRSAAAAAPLVATAAPELLDVAHSSVPLLSRRSRRRRSRARPRPSSRPAPRPTPARPAAPRRLPRSALRAIATTVSSSASEMNRTPMVTRPVGLTSPTDTRVTPPLAVIARTSSSSSTTSAPTREPRASANFIARTPNPPRPCRRYSSTRRPLGEAAVGDGEQRCPSGRATSIASSSSPPRNRMPMTPEVARPIGRSASSSP